MTSSSVPVLASPPTPSSRAYATGLWIALGGILMFFTALVSAFVVRKGLSTDTAELPLELPWRLLAANTAILLASGATLETARKKLRAAGADAFRRWWYATAALGIVFLAGQWAAWRAMAAAGFYAASEPDASFFYLFTAAHGLHVVGGIMALVSIAVRAPKRIALATAARLAAIYWHFLAALWCALFLFLAWGAK